MEAKPTLVGASLDAINVYGEIERKCIEAAIKANPYLNMLLPLYETLYKRGEGLLSYYDENDNFVLGARNKRGVRHGCVLGMFMLCITMEPVYARLKAVVGDEDVLYIYYDDSYLMDLVEQMATVLHHAPGIFNKVGLRIGYGPGKKELILPKGCSRQDFPFPLDDPHVATP